MSIDYVEDPLQKANPQIATYVSVINKNPGYMNNMQIFSLSQVELLNIRCALLHYKRCGFTFPYQICAC